MLGPALEGELLKSNVLIVDDHPPTRRQLHAFLEDQGMRVCGEAADGVDALEKIRKLQPAIVLLDIYMPRMNGFITALQIKEASPNTKIVFFTNHEAPRLDGAVRAMGGDAFVEKSDGIAKLAAVLDELLSTDVANGLP